MYPAEINSNTYVHPDCDLLGCLYGCSCPKARAPVFNGHTELEGMEW